MRTCLTVLLLAFIFTILAVVSYVMKPLPVSRHQNLSNIILSENGQVLASRLTSDGYRREQVRLSDIDPMLIKMLIIYEDQRFFYHIGVDPIALIRAITSWLKFGHITSGASTITMQTARLMYPELARKSISSKVLQMLMALRLEYHLSKEQILETYFTLAPYGGNIEGINAATSSWLNRSPHRLTLRESAFFVALPQSPENRRPDRFPDNAEEATSRVLENVSTKLGLSVDRLEELKNEKLPLRMFRKPKGYDHLLDRLGDKQGGSVFSTINKEWQDRTSVILDKHLSRLSLSNNAAAMVVELKSGSVRVYHGSAEYLDAPRKGAINYLNVLRSPGSTLKPHIYALALQRGLMGISSILTDTKIQVDGYAPTNFDDGFHGQVRLKEALIQSLNIPAINTLEMLGPNLVEQKIQSFLQLPPRQITNAGLSLAVGGQYLKGEQLAELYLGLFSHPSPMLRFLTNEETRFREPLISVKTSEEIKTLLSQIGLDGKPYILKTGTSDGRKDAWSIHLTQDHLVIVWVGAPDNLENSELSGAKIATPLGDDIIDSLGLEAPSISAISNQTNQSLLNTNKSCERLIQFPEDNEWILSSSGTISVFSQYSNIDWYLNGEKISLIDNSIQIKDNGAYSISAKKDDCITVHSIFVSTD